MHGHQHTAINLSAGAGLCGVILLLGQPMTALSLGAGIMFGILLITPDLDLALNDARRNWGVLRVI